MTSSPDPRGTGSPCSERVENDEKRTFPRVRARQEVLCFSLHSFTHVMQVVDFYLVMGEDFCCEAFTFAGFVTDCRQARREKKKIERRKLRISPRWVYCGFAVRGEANGSKAFTHNSMSHNSLHDAGEGVKAFFEKRLMRETCARVSLAGKPSG